MLSSLNYLFYTEVRIETIYSGYYNSITKKSGRDEPVLNVFWNGKLLSMEERAVLFPRSREGWVRQEWRDEQLTTHLGTTYCKDKTALIFKEYKFPFSLMDDSEKEIAFKFCKYLFGSTLTGICMYVAARALGKFTH